MTNRQWLLNKMQNMSDADISYILKNPCMIFKNVEECDDVKNRLGTNVLTCSLCAEYWLKQEYKEQIKLSDAERVILENIDKDYKWICRDENMNIYVFDLKPSKDEEYDCWDSDEGIGERLEVFNHLFQFIKWEDEQPYNIEELLEGNK